MTFETLSEIAKVVGQRTILIGLTADEFFTLSQEEGYTTRLTNRKKFLEGIGGNVTTFKFNGTTISIKIDTELA